MFPSLTEIPRGCTYEVLNASLSEEETREEVVVEIAQVLESIGIPNITTVFSTALGGILGGDEETITANETTDEPPLKTVYVAIAKEFEVEATDEGYSNFSEAVSQISEAKVAAWNGNVSDDDIPTLAREYRDLKKDVAANIIMMRDIFGKMLCLSERDRIRRRRETEEDPADCPEYGEDCACPGTETLCCVCEFFACLDPEDDIKPIMGLYDVFVEELGVPCLAFTVDTTGSMGTEIHTVKQVIRDFLSSEEEGPGCYVLQPFNDYLDGDFDPSSKLIINHSLTMLTNCMIVNKYSLLHRYSRCHCSIHLWRILH